MTVPRPPDEAQVKGERKVSPNGAAVAHGAPGTAGPQIALLSGSNLLPPVVNVVDFAFDDEPCEPPPPE